MARVDIVRARKCRDRLEPSAQILCVKLAFEGKNVPVRAFPLPASVPVEQCEGVAERGAADLDRDAERAIERFASRIES
jgi:hypothetical protein